MVKVDKNGGPVKPTKAQALGGLSRTPYDAADNNSAHMDDWQPFLWSPDGELNVFRDRIVSRTRDIVRNDGWASAAITRTLDNVIGADFRPISKPDYFALAQHTGIAGFDHKWAEEFGAAVESHYRLWANDPQKYCDAERTLTISQILRLAFRHKIVDGDALAILPWLPSRVGVGKGSYATTVQLVDPDRLSNPQYKFDVHSMRGGVEIDEFGAPIAYHIRKAHQGDWFNAKESLTWERIERETSWGRAVVVHDFDHDRASQHRGGAGILTSVLQRLKMLIKMDTATLDEAILNSIFGAYIESPFDQDLVEDALSDESKISGYQQFRVDYHNDAKLKLGNVRLPILAPGEKITSVGADKPSANFAQFESAVLRNIAAGTGMSAQQISQNWSEVNYSSYRAAMLEAWKTFNRRRTDFVSGFAQPIFVAWLEEAFDKGELPLPDGAPPFEAFRGLYSRAKWMGPGRGYVDPVKEIQGAILGMDSGLTTLESQAAELSGSDWREAVNQRQIEIEWFRERGIPLPRWSGEAEAESPPSKKTTSLPEAE